MREHGAAQRTRDDEANSGLAISIDPTALDYYATPYIHTGSPHGLVTTRVNSFVLGIVARVFLVAVRWSRKDSESWKQLQRTTLVCTPNATRAPHEHSRLGEALYREKIALRNHAAHTAGAPAAHRFSRGDHD